MKKRVFIIHGWGGSPQGGCLPWLKKELEAKGFEVVTPQMPNTEEPMIEEWVNYLAGIVGKPDEQTYFIGHSIGCQTIMRYLQTIEQKIGGALFIAGWFTLENLDEEELTVARPWLEDSIDFEKLKTVSNKYTLLISDNDPFGGYEQNIDSFKKMDAKIVVLRGQEHIGADEVPEALEEINNMVEL